MTVEMVDGIRVIKLKDARASGADRAADICAVAHIWMLLGGGHLARDTCIYSRRLA